MNSKTKANTMLMNNIPTISGDRFTWVKNIGTAELSDFGGKFSPARIYDDACDVGFAVVSHKTGKKVVFAEYECYVDNEGDIQYWVFVGVTTGYKNLKIMICND